MCIRDSGAGVPLWEATQLAIHGDALTSRAKNALASFVQLIEQLADETLELSLQDKIDHVLMRSGLRAHYEREYKGSIDSRVDNLDELVSVASRFNRGEDDESAQLTELVAFLAYAALEAGEGQADAGEEGVPVSYTHLDVYTRQRQYFCR